VAAKWYFPEALSEEAGALLDRQRAGEIELYAPDLLLHEFGSVVARKVRAGQVRPEDAEEVVREFLGSPPLLLRAVETLPVALRLRRVVRASFYDCTYLAAAELVGGTVVTADSKLVGLTGSASLDGVVQLLSEVSAFYSMPCAAVATAAQGMARNRLAGRARAKLPPTVTQDTR
jgi:predicted nucleic acid-binding protein